MHAKNEKTYPAYVWNFNSNREKQVTLLTIINGEGWYYLSVKKDYPHYLEKKLQKIMVIFIAWIFFLLLEQKTNLNLIKKYLKIL